MRALAVLGTLLVAGVLTPLTRAQFNVDALPEGTSGTTLAVGGYSLTDLDLGLGTAPDLFVVDDASNSLLTREGASFQPPNVVTFGSHLPGTDFRFGRCKSFTLRSSVPTTTLLLHLWFSRANVGNSVGYDFRLGAASVLAGSFPIPPGNAPYYVRWNPHFSGGTTFDNIVFTGSGPADGGRFECVVKAFFATTISFLPQCGGNSIYASINTPCPCGNNIGPFDSEGCKGSFGYGARLRSYGDASLSNDTFQLQCLQVPNTWAFVMQGTAGFPTATVFGDGLNCIGGTITRIATKFASNQGFHYPDVGEPPLASFGATPGSLTAYQVLYRNVASSYCTPATFNVSDSTATFWSP